MAADTGPGALHARQAQAAQHRSSPRPARPRSRAATRWSRPRHVPRRDRRLADRAAGRQARRAALHGLAPARAHPYLAVGHRRVHEERAARFPRVARGLLARAGRPARRRLGRERRPGGAGPPRHAAPRGRPADRPVRPHPARQRTNPSARGAPRGRPQLLPSGPARPAATPARRLEEGLGKPRDDTRALHPARRLLGSRRTLAQLVRRQAQAASGRPCLVRAAAGGRARRSRHHAEEILRHRWDLVIVDEAHKVKSQRGATYQFIEKIERDFILLLTATPLQNDLRELYNLITLLRPGQLGTWQEFKSEHLVSGDHRQPRDPAALRALTHEVMIRTRRSSVVDDLNLPPRRPRHPEVKLTRAEADLYQRTTDFLRRLYREGFIQPAEQEETEDGAPRRRTKKGILQLAVIHLRQRLCSSSRALAESLAHLAESERISPQYRVIATQLAKRAERIKTHAKLDVLTKLLKETPDRVVVFSDHRPTIQLIEERVKQLNRKPIVYCGAHSTADRDKRIRAFHDDKRSVLIATRAGSEGRNLQFCNVLVNYDLPWNPMVVEQRIGRLHRIGQTREVHIVNLAAAGAGCSCNRQTA